MPTEDFVEHLSDVIDKDESDTRLNACGDVVLDIGAVGGGRDDRLDPCAMRSEYFLLQAPYREDLADKRYFSGHGWPGL